MAKKTAKKNVGKKATKPATKKVTKKAPAAKAPKKPVKKPVAKKAAGKKPVKKPVAKSTPAGLIGDVEHLMQMMAAHDVTEIDLHDGNRQISLKRGGFVAPVAAVAAPLAAAPLAAAAAPAESPASPVDDGLIEIVSPMVGTYYSAPSPDSDLFTAVGATINAESVVCIVEAMKVMNEIKAECSGTITEICVQNAEPVEFGQVLFKVKP